MAMVAPVTAFILLFQDLGLSQAVVQARVLSPGSLNALFWINIAASVVIAALLLVIAPLAAAFYGDHRVGLVIAASALGVLISGTALQHNALMTRDMRMRALSMIDVVSGFATLAAAVVAALLLRSYWAIWVGALAGNATQAILLWSFDKWRPKLKGGFGEARQMVRFGGGVVGFNLVNFLIRNLDNVLVAKTAGTYAVGLYDQSYKLMTAPMQAVNAPLTRVMMPVLSRLTDEPERYRRAFLFSVRALLFVLMPGLAVVAALSQQIVTLVLGAKWAAAGPIFFWLSLTGLLQPLGNATGWLFLSSGRTYAMFRWGAASAVLTIFGFVVGLHWGAAGVAAGLFWTTLARMPVLFAYCVGGTYVRTRDLYLLLVEPSVGGAVGFVLARLLAPHLPTWGVLATCLPCAYALTAITYAVTPSGRAYFAAVGRLAAALLVRRLAKQPSERELAGDPA
jgi:PST family polysaccharide transporter